MSVYPRKAELNGEISETDCLTVDIYIPRNSPRPKGEQGILFWIHGGGYQTGDSKYYSGLEQAVTYGNIVVQVRYPRTNCSGPFLPHWICGSPIFVRGYLVSVQYRLGIYGFYNYKDETSGKTEGGNYALADLALGLKFISSNSEHLGAKPGQITLNGQSAGKDVQAF